MREQVVVRVVTVVPKPWVVVICLRRFPDLDTSQHGNGQRFRNEKLDGSRIEMMPKMFQNVRVALLPVGVLLCRLFELLYSLQMPTSGILEFDYVSAKRPSSRTRAIHSISLVRILRKSGIHDLVVSLTLFSSCYCNVCFCVPFSLSVMR